MRVLLALALAAPFVGPALVGSALVAQAVAGPLVYTKTGVVSAGRAIVWKDIGSLDERDADPLVEYSALAKGDTVAAQFAAGRWCRERGLQTQAAAHFTRVLELDAEHEGARCALGRAPELVAEQRRTLQPLPFADWCRDRALVDEQWAAIVEALAKDNWDREAIARVKPRME